jgi:predicted nucleic acid-binding protein
VKVFLDTNVLASALTTRGLCAELFEVVLQSHDLLTSDPVLRELERILPEKLGPA